MKVLALCAALVIAPCVHARHHRHRAPAPPAPSFFPSSQDIVSTAKSQLGNGPVYGRSNLWCARFVNYVLAKTGHAGTGSDLAFSFAKLPRTTMHVGAIAVLGRRGGGHVGIVSGVDAAGNPILVSGNNAGHVREAAYPARRILLYVEAN